MVKKKMKKKKVKKSETKQEAALTKERIEELIKAQVDKTGDKLTGEEKEDQIKALKKIFIEGESLGEAMGLPEEFPKLLYKQAYDQYNLGLYRDANHIFRFLCALDPHSPKYQTGLAATYQQLEDYEVASGVYMNAWFCDPRSPIPLVYCSDCFMKLGEPNSAYIALYLAVDACGTQQEYAGLKTRCYQMMNNLVDKHGVKPKADAEPVEGAPEGEDDIFSQLQGEAEKEMGS